ncbi:AraC family transcriptional regulator [Micromonospora sp. PLK6-60]|uniref:helix-turn-helix domain-containing protein n=1 Tax=Micromonospora sp. PLK6-60 TaxID=2873383 RepID=UPI001CA6A6B9|nr:AraC family transcriptional regulator [Micromonospora sp. PLK6-60]MBY8872662.1 AraC family transcriptional regulator [Micromonospora sp. PLK6-60]
MAGAEFVVGRPAPPLRPFVDRYLGYREPAPAPLIRTEVAGAFVVLVLGWGDPLDVVDPRAAERGAYGVDSFVAGPFDAYCTTSMVGLGAGVQLLLAPLAARRILGVPLGELANRAVAVGQLDDPWLDRLRGRLAEARDWPARFGLLDAALPARLAATGPVDRRLDRAWARLTGSDGRLGVATLAAELGWSRRHLAARFRAEIGLTPKTAGRLLRFQRAYATLARGPLAAPGRAGAVDGGWAERAAHLGYYDQSHLIRDFRRFAGATPTALAGTGSHSSNTG